MIFVAHIQIDILEA